MKQFKIRASGASNIMGIKGLGKTGETYIKTWIKEQLYNRHKEIQNKYLQKGNECEDNSLDYIADQLDYGVLVKNEEYFEDEYFCGTPDVILKDHLIDVKNSWDCFTFPLFETSINPAYLYQAQIYMHLTGIHEYELIYVLSDTPQHLIEKEAYYYCKNNGFEDLDPDVLEKFNKKMTYGDIPDKYRYKVYNISYDKAIIKTIQERTIECRGIISKLTKQL